MQATTTVAMANLPHRFALQYSSAYAVIVAERNGPQQAVVLG